MIGWTNNSPLTNPGIDYDMDHLASSLWYMLHNYVGPNNSYECDCSKCGFKYYTEIKQCNCPHCGCDDEHFRCTELK